MGFWPRYPSCNRFVGAPTWRLKGRGISMSKMQSAINPNPALEDLAVLVGEWEFTSPQFPDARGQITFEWIEEGACLVERMAGNATWVIGRDESGETYCILYSDARGVSRVYESSFEGNVWKIWRNAPGFSQRFQARLSDDGSTLKGAWEKSADGVQWDHDFDITYKRVN